MAKKGTYKDITGQTFERWKVLSFSHINEEGSNWNCLCECGVEKVIRRNSLVSSNSRSCGCLNREGTLKASVTHGLTNHPIYSTWVNIKQRCTNPKVKNFHNYGGRGIKMCDRWLNSFENFLTDMGEKPSPNHSIDRIDNNGNYEPSNCRWATDSEQIANTRFNRPVLHKETGIFYDTTNEAARTYGVHAQSNYVINNFIKI